MAPRTRPTVAICYDFDGTLAPGNMQEHDFIPQLGLNSKQFWDLVHQRAQEQDADEILTYMKLMIERAQSARKSIRRQAFLEYGANLSFFPGVLEWFPRVTAWGEEHGLDVKHFIISSGLKEMIQGTPIAKFFSRIFASAFMYTPDGVAEWPAMAVNYTTKTQFLFRINKGHLETWDNKGVNAFVPPDDRPVPFKRMIFIGDGTTDVPCMRLVKELGGYAIGVYAPSKSRDTANKLLQDQRVHFVASADYTENSDLDTQVRHVMARMAADWVVQRSERAAAPRKSSAKKDKSRQTAPIEPVAAVADLASDGAGPS